MRRKIAAALGLIALLLNLVSWVTFGYKPANLAEEAFVGGAIALCSSNGVRVLDRDSEPLKPHQDGKPHCAFCLPLLDGGGMFVREVALAPPFERAEIDDNRLHRTSISLISSNSVWSRAPPPPFLG